MVLIAEGELAGTEARDALHGLQQIFAQLRAIRRIGQSMGREQVIRVPCASPGTQSVFRSTKRVT